MNGIEFALTCDEKNFMMAAPDGLVEDELVVMRFPFERMEENWLGSSLTGYHIDWTGTVKRLLKLNIVHD